MKAPDQIGVRPPAFFDAFYERRTKAQRRRAIATRIVGRPYRVYARLRGRG